MRNDFSAGREEVTLIAYLRHKWTLRAFTDVQNGVWAKEYETWNVIEQRTYEDARQVIAILLHLYPDALKRPWPMIFNVPIVYQIAAAYAAGSGVFEENYCKSKKIPAHSLRTLKDFVQNNVQLS